MKDKDFKIGDYIIYDNPNDYADEGTVIDTDNCSFVQIESINGYRRIFFKSEFKYLFNTYIKG